MRLAPEFAFDPASACGGYLMTAVSCQPYTGRHQSFGETLGELAKCCNGKHVDLGTSVHLELFGMFSRPSWRVV